MSYSILLFAFLLASTLAFTLIALSDCSDESANPCDDVHDKDLHDQEEGS